MSVSQNGLSVTVLGQTYALPRGVTRLSSLSIGAYVYVVGERLSTGQLVATRIAGSKQPYVAGASEIFLTGIVSKTELSTGFLSVGELKVYVADATVRDGIPLALGETLEIVGTQAQPLGAVWAREIRVLNGNLAAQGIQGTGTSGIQGTGTSGIQGTGTSGIQGTGTTGIRGTGTSGIQGTGTLGIQGTGKSGIQGTGTSGIQGTGTLGIQGTPSRDRYVWHSRHRHFGYSRYGHVRDPRYRYVWHSRHRHFGYSRYGHVRDPRYRYVWHSRHRHFGYSRNGHVLHPRNWHSWNSGYGNLGNSGDWRVLLKKTARLTFNAVAGRSESWTLHAMCRRHPRSALSTCPSRVTRVQLTSIFSQNEPKNSVFASLR